MTRDEAIGRIKARFDKWALDDEDMKAIQTLIPELAESKDERIIKTIRQLLETARDAHSNTSLAKPFIDALAWLEKQKEQNGEDEECTDFTIYYPLKNGKGEYECIPYSFYDSLTFFSEDKDLIDFHRACFYTEEECNEWIEQHKEEEGYEAIPVESTLEYKLGFKAGKESEKQKEQKPAWSEEDEKMLDSIIRVVCGVGIQPNGLREKQVSFLKSLRPQKLDASKLENFDPVDVLNRIKTEWPMAWEKVVGKQEWSEEDEEMLDIVLTMVDCSTVVPHSGGQLHPSESYKKDISDWLKSLRPQYHGDVTMTEAYKMGLEAGKASSWKPSEKQTNNVIVELTRIELGDIINGLYYLKEKYYEDCKEHNGTATMGLSDEFKFYFKRFNEVLDLYTRLHKLEKEKYGTTTDGYYYE